MGCYWLANTATPVSLFLIGLRRIRPHAEPIGGAADPSAPSIQDMGVDHGRADISMAKKFLDRPNIVPILKQVGGKGMAEGVRRPAGLVEVESGGAGTLALHSRCLRPIGDETNDPLLHLGHSGDALRNCYVEILAPRLLALARNTTPSPLSDIARRAACSSFVASPSSVARPYTVGPQELCPTPSAPARAIALATLAPSSLAKVPPWMGLNQPPTIR